MSSVHETSHDMVKPVQSTSAFPIVGELRTELVRKSIHILIGFTPLLASTLGVPLTMGLLASGIAAYTLAEVLRLRGVKVPLITRLTALSARRRDGQGFVLGPVTLGFGAFLALLCYPEPASALALYALAFGDGLASLAGKFFGRIRIPFTGGKSLEGSLACFLAILVVCSLVYPGAPSWKLMVIALGATVLEALPTRDFDNIVIPLGTGLLAWSLFLA